MAQIFTANTFAMSEGEKIFNRECLACHGASNEATGTLLLARTRGADKAVLTERTGLSEEYVRYVVRHGLGAMPPFAPVGLNESELDSLAKFLAN